MLKLVWVQYLNIYIIDDNQYGRPIFCGVWHFLTVRQYRTFGRSVNVVMDLSVYVAFVVIVVWYCRMRCLSLSLFTFSVFGPHQVGVSVCNDGQLLFKYEIYLESIMAGGCDVIFCFVCSTLTSFISWTPWSFRMFPALDSNSRTA